MLGDIIGVTDKEKELLMIFRSLNQYEQSVFLGKISEMALNKKKGNLVSRNSEITYVPVVFVFIY